MQCALTLSTLQRRESIQLLEQWGQNHSRSIPAAIRKMKCLRVVHVVIKSRCNVCVTNMPLLSLGPLCVPFFFFFRFFFFSFRILVHTRIEITAASKMKNKNTVGAVMVISPKGWL